MTDGVIPLEEARRREQEARRGTSDSVERFTTPTAPPSPTVFSEDALAIRFVQRHGDDHRYVAAWMQWYSWGGNRWELEATLHVFYRARLICRIAASEVEKPGTKTRLGAAKTATAVERLAKADRRIAATVDQWDSNHGIINYGGPAP